MLCEKRCFLLAFFSCEYMVSGLWHSQELGIEDRHLAVMPKSLSGAARWGSEDYCLVLY